MEAEPWEQMGHKQAVYVRTEQAPEMHFEENQAERGEEFVEITSAGIEELELEPRA